MAKRLCSLRKVGGGSTAIFSNIYQMQNSSTAWSIGSKSWQGAKYVTAKGKYLFLGGLGCGNQNYNNPAQIHSYSCSSDARNAVTAKVTLSNWNRISNTSQASACCGLVCYEIDVKTVPDTLRLNMAGADMVSCVNMALLQVSIK